MALTPLQRSVLFTLTYTSQFLYPLTADEVWSRLVIRLGDRRRVVTKAPKPEQVKRAVESLVQKKLVKREGISYSLVSRPALAPVRRRRFSVAQTKWREARQAVRIFQHIPWIQAIYITGSLAMNNTEPEDDIDFLIVTSSRRLWLTRVVVSVIAWLSGKRRSWHGEEQRSWCFNLWLEETELGLFGRFPSVYTAYELVQARPLLDRSRVDERLMVANKWLRGFLPSAALGRMPSKIANSHWVAVSRGRRVGDRFNRWAYRLQQWYMRSHKTREKVTLRYALFHPRDTQGWLYWRWTQELESLT